ncbi:NAD-dependent protein deacylase [Lapidilactobacillus dextrinicus]|uniref:NAD-dependent protein deacylase n=1 Tax=Lapidilactobacillus dextrinicus TaxID=51664 RepID=UPI0022E9157D|nr:NAD-dependent protein deacylase [Lapidilactobacillus dextrinicus]
MPPAIVNLAANIQAAHKIVFLTGAGVSTHSGIPDYRSKSGLYAHHTNPEYLLSHENLQDHPQDFYDFVQQRMYYPEAKPNLIHQEIAIICQDKGILITQNVDGLDQQAGNQHLIEFHGNLYDLYCQKCGQTIDYEQYQQDYHHPEDGGIIRPRIVLYGESIDPFVIQDSISALTSADLVIIVGTSFRVYPFAQLLQYCSPTTAIFAINNEPITTPGIELLQMDALTAFTKLKEVLD